MSNYLLAKGIDIKKINTIELKFLVSENMDDDYFKNINDHTIARFSLLDLMNKVSQKELKLNIIFENIGDLKQKTHDLRLNKNLSKPRR